VPHPRQVAPKQEVRTAEEALRPLAGRTPFRPQGGLVRDHGQAQPATAGGALDHERIADLAGRHHRVGQVRHRPARYDGDAGRGDPFPRRDLVGHGLDRLRLRPDPDPAGRLDGARGGGVLGQESGAGMHGFGAAEGRGLEHAMNVQVGLTGRRGAEQDGFVGHPDRQRPAIGLGVDRDGLHAQPPARLDDPDGDLTAAGYQDGLEHAGSFLCPATPIGMPAAPLPHPDGPNHDRHVRGWGEGGITMAKRSRKRKARAKKGANHGKRPNC
jgi:hypothetical protein